MVSGCGGDVNIGGKGALEAKASSCTGHPNFERVSQVNKDDGGPNLQVDWYWLMMTCGAGRIWRLRASGPPRTSP